MFPPATVGGTCRLDRFPAGTVSHVDTKDFEQFREFTQGWNLDHQLMGAENHIKMFLVTTPTMQFGRVQHSSGYNSQGQNPKGAISFALPLDEARPMIHRGHAIDSLHMGMVQNGEGYELRNPAGADQIVTTFSAAKFDQYASVVWRDSAPRQRKAQRFGFRNRTQKLRYVQAAQAILADVRRQPTLLQDSRAAALLEDRLFESVFLHAHFDDRYSPDPSRHQIARRAFRYMLENLEEVPSVRKLCSITGVSYMTLERGFWELYGMGPLQQIKAVRLSRARRELLHPLQRTTVTSTALHWGFFELGRFSVQYRECFGESPSETLRKSRGEKALLTPAGMAVV